MGMLEDDIDYGMKIDRVLSEFAAEFHKARSKFGPMASAHEGLAVIEEEFLELRTIVYQKQSERNYDMLRKEAVQMGAMTLAFIMEIVSTNNRR